jgi:hypothetical protein
MFQFWQHFWSCLRKRAFVRSGPSYIREENADEWRARLIESLVN